MWSATLYMLIVGYTSNDPVSILLSPLSALFILVLMAGALFPDIDWIIERHVWRHFGHRNPITHSVAIPAVLLIFWLHFSTVLPKVESNIRIVDSELGRLNIAYNFDPVTTILQVFFIGVALHLLEDNIKTGNLVWIGKRHEEYWYFLQGGLTLLVLALTGFFKWRI